MLCLEGISFGISTRIYACMGVLMVLLLRIAAPFVEKRNCRGSWLRKSLIGAAGSFALPTPELDRRWQLAAVAAARSDTAELLLKTFAPRPPFGEVLRKQPEYVGAFERHA